MNRKLINFTKNFLIILLLFLFFAAASHDNLQAESRIHLEKWYQDNWCNEHNGETEVVLSDRTRCDCVTDDYAIEFDFGNKWAEGIGQCLYYSTQTGKQPGLALILEHDSDYKYYIRASVTVEEMHLPITIWIVRPWDFDQKSKSGGF